MKTESIMKAINALPRGAALCEHFAYMNHEATEEDGPVMLVDIIAWRTHSQKDEDARWHHVDTLVRAIESLPGVAGVEQVGNIDHENGRGWTFQVTLA